MLMYHTYIPLSQLFSPCLALAREIVNRFLQLSSVGFQLLQDVLGLGVKLAGAGLSQLLAELREAASRFAVQLGLAPGLPALLFLTR